MQVGAVDELDFRSDLIKSGNCEKPACQRVADHAAHLMRATVLLKSHLIQQHQAQNSINLQSRYEHTNGAIVPTRSDYTALQRQVEAGLTYQREVCQLRREIEFQRETINNYKQLLNDGNNLREELRNELNLARKSASIARASLEEERRHQMRSAVSANPPLSEASTRCIEIYKEENAKLRETVRILTDKEMNLTSKMVRLKDYVEEEADRLTQSKGHKMERTFSGAWFMGLLGLLGLPCSSNLEYYLTAPTTPPHSFRNRLQSPHSNRQIPPSKTALQNILNELEEVEAPKVVKQSSVDKSRRKTKSSRKRSRKSKESSAALSPVKQTTRGRRLSASFSDSSFEHVLVSKKSKSSAMPSNREAKTSQSQLSFASTSSKSILLPDITVTDHKSHCDYSSPMVDQTNVDLDDLDTSTEIEADSLAGKNENMSIVIKEGELLPCNSLFSGSGEKFQDEQVMSRTNPFDTEEPMAKEMSVSETISILHTTLSEGESEAPVLIDMDILAEKNGKFQEEIKKSGPTSPSYLTLCRKNSKSAEVEPTKVDFSAVDGNQKTTPRAEDGTWSMQSTTPEVNEPKADKSATGNERIPLDVEIPKSPASLSSKSSDVCKPENVQIRTMDSSVKKVSPLEKRRLTQRVQLHRTTALPSSSSLPDFASTDRIQTRPSSVGLKKKKPFIIPSSLEDIITRRFSKSVFNWFDALTTYQSRDGVEENGVFSPQPSEPISSKKSDSQIEIVQSVSKTFSSPHLNTPTSPEKLKSSQHVSPIQHLESNPREISASQVKTENDPSRSCLPLGSCVAMESGIVTSSQPISLLDNLVDHLAGKRPFVASSASPNIIVDLICDALTQALEIIPQLNSSLSLFPPPDPVLRAAALLKSLGKSSEISSFTSWFRVRPHLRKKKKRRYPPKPPLLLFRLAQLAFLTCELAKHKDLLYQIVSLLAFNGHLSTPVTCLLLAFQSCPSPPLSSLDLVYHFLAWKEADSSPVVDEFISALRQTVFWSEVPSITSLRDLLSTLVDDFCYGKKGLDSPESAEDTARALRLLLTVHAFTELDVKKSAANRFGLTGWLLKARLLNWVNNLEKSLEVNESAIKLLLRVCSLSVDVILLAAQLDIQRSPSNPPRIKVPSPCQRGLSFCCDKIFKVLTSIPNTTYDQIPSVIFCLLRLVPCLNEEQLTKFRGILIGLSEEKISSFCPLDVRSILPPLQDSFINHTLERLKLSPNQQLVQALRKLLKLDL